MGDWDRAGVLHGFAQVFQDRAGIPRDEFDERYRQDSLAQARARMGDEPLERACAQGMTFSLEKAFDLATAAAEPGPGAAPAVTVGERGQIASGAGPGQGRRPPAEQNWSATPSRLASTRPPPCLKSGSLPGLR
jgi:hypothetical protein